MGNNEHKEAETEICGFDYSSPNEISWLSMAKTSNPSEYPDSNCERQAWRNANRCIWHTKEENKPIDELIKARKKNEEVLIGAYLNGINVQDKISFEGCDLRKSNLSNANFSGANFHNANISEAYGKGTDFEKADFSKANLSSSVFPESNFAESNILRSDFSNAILRDCSFNNTDLYGLEQAIEASVYPYMWGVEEDPDIGEVFSSVWFDGADLRSSDFSKSNLKFASFNSCNINHGTFSQAKMREIDAENANLTHSDLEKAELPGSNLQKSQLQGSNFSGAMAMNVNLDHSEGLWARFDEADIRFSSISEAEFPQSSFKGADLREVDFEGTNLEETVCTGADIRSANFENSRMFQSILTDVRIDVWTNFGEELIYENEDEFGGWERDYQDMPWNSYEFNRKRAAVWTYRRLARLYRENEMEENARKFNIMRGEAKRDLYLDNSEYVSWGISTINKWFSKYGESPLQVILMAIAVITFGAIVYPVFGLDLGQGTGVTTYWNTNLAETGNVLLKSVYLSIVNFTTLGSGDFRAVGISSGIAALESLLGALLMALFVFVLGRRVA